MKQVRIYTANYCNYCDRAKAHLRGKGVDFEEVDVTHDDDLRARLVEMAGGLRTVPQIFIGNRHVGGYTDMMKLDAEGKLDSLLNEQA